MPVNTEGHGALNIFSMVLSCPIPKFFFLDITRNPNLNFGLELVITRTFPSSDCYKKFYMLNN